MTRVRTIAWLWFGVFLAVYMVPALAASLVLLVGRLPLYALDYLAWRCGRIAEPMYVRDYRAGLARARNETPRARPVRELIGRALSLN